MKKLQEYISESVDVATLSYKFKKWLATSTPQERDIFAELLHYWTTRRQLDRTKVERAVSLIDARAFVDFMTDNVQCQQTWDDPVVILTQVIKNFNPDEEY